ncbi:MAG: squalene/phytoene synthase family protein [Verrucomicrobiae bacterium]|nr:squalene/phytoene synthase family protein [Verrucomicrobiae bacterium]
MLEIPPPPSADAIVRAAGSNLAFALAVLPRAKRRDMRVFYAFCRIVDDIADDDGLPLDQRRAGLDRWREVIAGTGASARPGLEREFAELRDRLDLPGSLLHEIVNGVEMDLVPRFFQNWEELRQYCFRVASAVGLVSIEIFGYREPQTRVYAEELGYALQLTNILRDVAEDAARGRVYLPLDDLGAHGLAADDLPARRHDDERFGRLMAFEADRAERFFRAAAGALPATDRPSMVSAELMGGIYHRILRRMRADGFRVFERRYRLSKAEMLARLIRAKLGF